MFVPVVDQNQKPLMPTKPSRARRWMRDKKATPFWKNGVFCLRLNVDPSDRYFQEICVGVDPGSKKEGFTVKSEAHTYLNIQADAHSKVGKKVEKRRELRRGRRSRKCPNRKQKQHNLSHRNRIPAGTRARWTGNFGYCIGYQSYFRGEGVVDNTDIFCLSPIPMRRRELHKRNPQKGGKRPRYGGTTCNGLVKNTLVRHIKRGLTRISRFSKTGISLYSVEGKRLCQNAKIQDCKVLTRLNFNYRSGVSSPH